MPPDHLFPVGLDDTVEAYRFVLERHRPENLVVSGGSAGGGLAASFLLKARDLGLPLPRACVLATPEADLTESGDTFETNDTIDIILRHRLSDSIALYANGHDLRDPYLSPIFGDFTKGFPPTLLTSGTRDLFLSNTVILHRALLRAGIPAELHVWEAMPHGGFFGAPEDDEVTAEQVRFIHHWLDCGGG
jgi:acetyl esterase/lipase